MMSQFGITENEGLGPLSPRGFNKGLNEWMNEWMNEWNEMLGFN